MLRPDIQFEDLGQFDEDDGLWLFIFVVIVFEVVFHTNLLEFGYVFHDNFLEQLILGPIVLTFRVSSQVLSRMLDQFEYEQLILLLFVHHQVLATDDGEPFLVIGLLNTYDLIWLSCLGWQQLNWYFVILDKGLRVIHEHLVYFGD